MHKASETPLLALIEAGGINDIPVIIAPAAITSDALLAAIKTVKAAGYRVAKSKKPKTVQRGNDHVGPTFVAEFADGTVTRMSTFTSLEKLDWERGEACRSWHFNLAFKHTKSRPPSYRRGSSRTARCWRDAIAKAARHDHRGH